MKTRMTKNTIAAAFALTVAACFAFWGCGSEADSFSTGTDTDTEQEYAEKFIFPKIGHVMKYKDFLKNLV